MSLPENAAQLQASPAPFYLPSGNEVTLFEHCHARGLAVMLRADGLRQDPLGRAYGRRLQRPLITIACHDDLSASDLIGRFLIRHDGTVYRTAR